MVITCPFCGMDWSIVALLEDFGAQEGGLCDCGAWWYEGLDDAEDEEDD